MLIALLEKPECLFRGLPKRGAIKCLPKKLMCNFPNNLFFGTSTPIIKCCDYQWAPEKYIGKAMALGYDYVVISQPINYPRPPEYGRKLQIHNEYL